MDRTDTLNGRWTRVVAVCAALAAGSLWGEGLTSFVGPDGNDACSGREPTMTPIADVAYGPEKPVLTAAKAISGFRKVADSLWITWVGTTGYSCEVDRAGVMELVP